MMIDYSDHQPYHHHHREGSATPILDCEEEEEESLAAYHGKLKLTEVAVDDYSPQHSDVYEDDYDVHYDTGKLNFSFSSFFQIFWYRYSV